MDDAATELFGSYDAFLGMLAGDSSRNHLENLSEVNADDDEHYQTARAHSHRFRDGLLKLFFDPASGMDDLTRNYGVF